MEYETNNDWVTSIYTEKSRIPFGYDVVKDNKWYKQNQDLVINQLVGEYLERLNQKKRKIRV